MRREDMLFVGGECSPPSTGDVIEVISPHTEAVIARVAAAGADDVDGAVAAARSREGIDGYVDTKSVSVARRG